MTTTTIKKVSSTLDPDDNRDAPDESTPLPRSVREGFYFDARVPPNIIDTIRKDARQRTYGSTTQEAETIRAVDEAAFEKVRAAEQHQINRADALIERNKGRVGRSLSYVEQLDDLRARLRAGEDTQTIAKAFNALERDIHEREIKVLRGMAAEAESIEESLADPVSHVQHLYTLMPLGFGRAAGLIHGQ